MEVNHLFRRLVFVLVLLSIVAFCMAEENAGLMLIAGAIAALSWYIVEGPTGRPAPLWTVHVGAVVAVGWLIFEIINWRSAGVGEIEVTRGMIVAMGHFTIWLQILQMFGQKGNREYALILVLGLMQMIGASVLNPSMVYGLLLAAYSVLMLWTILLFQFKALSDQVYEQMKRSSPDPQTVKHPPAAVGRGVRWQFRLTAVMIAAACVLVATAVFVGSPRRQDAPLGAGLLGMSSTSQVGFSQQVHLRGGSLNPGGDQIVMTIELHKNDQPLGPRGLGLLLRGAALDEYDARTHTWRRSTGVAGHDQRFRMSPQTTPLVELATRSWLEARIVTRHLSEGVLMTPFPPLAITCDEAGHARFNPYDQRLAVVRPPRNGVLHYTVRAPVGSGTPDLFKGYQEQFAPAKPFNTGGRFFPSQQGMMFHGVEPEQAGYGWSSHADQIRQLTLDILAEKDLSRDPQAATDPRDALIVSTLSGWLQNPTRFTYTLENPAGGETEPLVSFLFEHRAGHCELFASALAAMTRSIGMRARVATGYRVSEYNTIGDYFVVRQNNAHAWCEIELPETGWTTVDPTPPGDLQEEHAPRSSWLRDMRDFYEYMEMHWLSGFLAYDDQTRTRVFGNVRSSLEQTLHDDDAWLKQTIEAIKATWRNTDIDWAGYTLIGVSTVFIIVGLVTLARLAVNRRRRIAALRLTDLPRAQRRALTQRLRFYLIMLDMLERHGRERAVWQTPAAFADQLILRDGPRFASVAVLTELFYEIRFGHRDLDESRKHCIREHMHRLHDALAAGG